MKISIGQYAESLYLSTKDKTQAEIKKSLDNFFNIIITNNDLSKIDKIIQEFINYWNKEEKIIEVKLTGAREFDKKVINEINEFLKDKTGAEKIIISEEIEDNIIGGVIIKYNDKILDGSIKTRLNELKENMINS